jgi:hypothetical protein
MFVVTTGNSKEDARIHKYYLRKKDTYCPNTFITFIIPAEGKLALRR